jgi:hypothetical protein
MSIDSARVKLPVFEITLNLAARKMTNTEKESPLPYKPINITDVVQ